MAVPAGSGFTQWMPDNDPNPFAISVPCGVYKPVPLSNMREFGGRDIIVYCGGMNCYHHAVLNADRWADDVRFGDLERRMVCTKCGHRGAEVRAYQKSNHVSGLAHNGYSLPTDPEDYKKCPPPLRKRRRRKGPQ